MAKAIRDGKVHFWRPPSDGWPATMRILKPWAGYAAHWYTFDSMADPDNFTDDTINMVPDKDGTYVQEVV